MNYVVKKGDSLWKIARIELNDPKRWPEIARLNNLESPYLLHIDQRLRLPPKQAFGKRQGINSETLRQSETPSPTENLLAATTALENIKTEVDKIPELKGCSIILQFPDGKLFQLRTSNHSSGLETHLVAKLEIPEPADEESWWDRWNGVILNCGGAAISWAGLAAASAAEVPSMGGATPLVILAYTSATATTVQCGLAIAKESSTDFQEFLETEDGKYVDYADVALDAISLAGGVGSAIALVKTGKLLKTAKYGKMLNETRKGKLIKILQRIEQQEKDLKYFREAVAKLVQSGKVADPAGRVISNNILRRSMPFITQSLKLESLAQLAELIGASAAVASSFYGGSGPRNLGLVKVTIQLLQERVDK